MGSGRWATLRPSHLSVSSWCSMPSVLWSAGGQRRQRYPPLSLTHFIRAPLCLRGLGLAQTVIKLPLVWAGDILVPASVRTEPLCSALNLGGFLLSSFSKTNRFIRKRFLRAHIYSQPCLAEKISTYAACETTSSGIKMGLKVTESWMCLL